MKAVNESSFAISFFSFPSSISFSFGYCSFSSLSNESIGGVYFEEGTSYILLLVHGAGRFPYSWHYEGTKLTDGSFLQNILSSPFSSWPLELKLTT